MPNKNNITLAHYFVNYWLIHVYNVYTDLVSAVDVTTVGDYSKSINQKYRYKTIIEYKTTVLLSTDNICCDSTQFSEWAKDIATVLSYYASADSYTLLIYLVREKDAENTYNTANPKLTDPRSKPSK